MSPIKEQEQEQPARSALRMIVIYHAARDYPDHHFVARQMFLVAGKIWASRQLLAAGQTLREVRECVPPWMVCIARQPGEDPVIVETWI